MAGCCGRGCRNVHVVASGELAPEMREFERASTTVADAYLGPVVGGYLRRLGGGRRRRAGCRRRW